jgi:outer membrane protein assembly factor BamD (BamD/ComL family)
VPSLAREVALIDSARTTLARGDAQATLQLLDTHDHEYPAGPLLPESQVLRIEALVRAGSPSDLKRARSLGEAFLKAHPSGPQARRVRTVLDQIH